MGVVARLYLKLKSCGSGNFRCIFAGAAKFMNIIIEKPKTELNSEIQQVKVDFGELARLDVALETRKEMNIFENMKLYTEYCIN